MNISTSASKLTINYLMFLTKLRLFPSSLRSTHTMASIGSLQRMTAKTLSSKILEEKDLPTQSYAIIDVREDDYIGGHIKGSINIPSRQLDAMMPTLIRRLQDKKIVVFHCMLSQQRGPSAALRYLRERGGDVEDAPLVYLLDSGFTGWQQVFAEDERLTEGYRKELWIED